MPKQMELHLVGGRHHVAAQTILEIANCCPMEVKLVREPDNQTDENAIAVYAEDDPWDGMKLGFVSRHTAEVLAPRIDKNQIEIERATLEELDSSGHGPLTMEFTKLR